MLIPVRCFSCGNVIGQHWSDYKMFVGQVELIDEIAPFTVYRQP